MIHMVEYVVYFDINKLAVMDEMSILKSGKYFYLALEGGLEAMDLRK
jgi:hypothetical protein